MKLNLFRKFLAKRARHSGFGLAVILVVAVMGLLALIGLGQYLATSGSLQRGLAQQRDNASLERSFQLLGRVSSICSQALKSDALGAMEVSIDFENQKELDSFKISGVKCEGGCVAVNTLKFSQNTNFPYLVAATNQTFQSGLLIKSIRLEKLRFEGSVSCSGTYRFNYIKADLVVDALTQGGPQGGRVMTSRVRGLNILLDISDSHKIEICGTKGAQFLGEQLNDTACAEPVDVTAGGDPL